MPDLSAWLLATALTQIARFPCQSVAGGWFAAVVAVLDQPSLELLHPRQQRGILLALVLYDGFECSDACFWRHAHMVRLLGKSG